MKLILFSHDAGGYGGASKSFLTIVEGLKNKGYELLVIIPGNGIIEEKLMKLQVNYHIVYYPWWFRPAKYHTPHFLSKIKANLILPLWLPVKYSYFYMNAIFKLDNAIKKFKPDLIYTSTLAIPMGVFVSKRYKIKHTWHIREFVEEDMHAKFVYPKKIIHFFINSSTFNIYISKALQKKFQAPCNNNFLLVPNAVYSKEELLDNQDLIEHRGFSSETLKFMAVGRLSNGKGVDVNIRAMANLKKAAVNCSLTMLGHGNIEYYKNIAKEQQVADRVEFTGRVTNIKEYYLSHDILILASDKEAFGRVLIEAMAYGTIVIARKAGGVTDIVQEGKNGFLFTEEQEIVPLVKHILTLTAEELQQIRKQAYNDCLQNYTTEKLHGNMDSIFQKLYKN